ncbi:MAG: DUF484 family protein [Rhodospirillales bacterium]|jgi:uncharacterized protein|nr:DUF484 family protein [Rhodospirillales bacterium]
MNDNSTTDKPISTNDAQIEEFLEKHPDFFVAREELLARMTPPRRWKGDGVVDLQKTMLDYLRGEMEDMKNGARDLIETSRSNMSSQARVHDAVLALMTADGLVAGLRTICDEWPLILDVDVVAIGFEVPLGEQTEPPVRSVRLLAEGFVDDLIGIDRKIALVDEAADDGTIFGEGAGLVHSAALARIGADGKTPAGLLALGARDSAFQPGQGTELIGFLARITETCIGQWLEKPL